MTILLTTIHDPDNKMYVAARKMLPYLLMKYNGAIVEMTCTTHPWMKQLLQDNAQVFLSRSGDIAGARRSLLRRSLIYGDTCHFCDFDRLLFWQIHYPEELSQTIAYIKKHDFTIIGRTKAAFDSHPFVQKQTERVVNKVFRQATGLGGVDVLAASRGISSKAARLITGQSKANGPAGIDVEWPFIARDMGVGYTTTNGLAYESDEFGIRRKHLDEIKLRLTNMVQGIYETDRCRQLFT